MNEKPTEISLKSDPRNLAEARKFVEDIATKLGFNEEQVFDIKVAIGEAVSNAIEHGSPKGPLNSIKITVKFLNDALELNVTDEGVFKRAIKVDDPDPHHRGRGIPFMLALMDTVTINEAKGGTTVRLVKKLTKKG